MDPWRQKGGSVLQSYTARYAKIDSGYIGQLLEWPEVVTEGSTIEECRSMLRDALQEMILAYRQLGQEVPVGNDLFEQVAVDLDDGRQTA
jgi:predicted RNase H-like HicB family nuclease